MADEIRTLEDMSELRKSAEGIRAGMDDNSKEEAAALDKLISNLKEAEKAVEAREISAAESAVRAAKGNLEAAIGVIEGQGKKVPPELLAARDSMSNISVSNVGDAQAASAAASSASQAANSAEGVAMYEGLMEGATKGAFALGSLFAGKEGMQEALQSIGKWNGAGQEGKDVAEKSLFEGAVVAGNNMQDPEMSKKSKSSIFVG